MNIIVELFKVAIVLYFGYCFGVLVYDAIMLAETPRS